MRVGTDVFAGRSRQVTTCSLDLKHVEHQTRESIFVFSEKTHRVDYTSAWRAARRLDGPFSRCLRLSSTWEVTQYRMYQRSHVYLFDECVLIHVGCL